MKRKINIDKLDNNQLETAIEKISIEINKEVDYACEKANKLLNRYGLQCKMAVVIEALKNDAEAGIHDKI
jgi:hypothetical protein